MRVEFLYCWGKYCFIKS